MSDAVVLALQIAGLVVFWAGFIWLFWSKAGNTVFRWFAAITVPILLGVSLFWHWEPYTAIICGTAGLISGVFIAEWHYDIRNIIAQREDLARQPR